MTPPDALCVHCREPEWMHALRDGERICVSRPRRTTYEPAPAALPPAPAAAPVQTRELPGVCLGCGNSRDTLGQCPECDHEYDRFESLVFDSNHAQRALDVEWFIDHYEDQIGYPERREAFAAGAAYGRLVPAVAAPAPPAVLGRPELCEGCASHTQCRTFEMFGATCVQRRKWWDAGHATGLATREAELDAIHADRVRLADELRALREERAEAASLRGECERLSAIADRAVDAKAALEQRVAALVAAARAVCDAPAYFDYDRQTHVCHCCGRHKDEDGHDIEHAGSCPIAALRAALKEGM